MSVKFKDYYEILGVPRSATEDEIKKAYRKQARKWHPDLHKGEDQAQAEARFKDINEANEVLSDAAKRQRYDTLGANWRSGSDFSPPPGYENVHFDFGGGDFSDFFESVFGGGVGGQFRGARGRQARAWTQPGGDVESELRLALEDAYHGAVQRLSLRVPASCGTCNGTGRRGNQQVCHACGGTGSVSQVKTVEVKIPKGVREGQRIRLAGYGEAGSGGATAGDLYLRVALQPHATFQVSGDDVVVELPVAPHEAVLGAEVQVPTLDGPVTMTVPSGSQAGQKLRLKGRGWPRKQGGHGDEHVRLKIVVPSRPTSEEKHLYEELAKTSHWNPREKTGR